ncbi:ABC transporter ATP-binding protein [Promethearchaeum syntrophicum]|uniref:ABC transporter ATP-binding protein n=1 Tax=Promethearchaeum syntrophicum TaxID=2594042 RepID=A0A5B9DCT2_9ARCH|nr:ABC transporter ATP-binding protein [Candidatus Prometheoarchaeum syntrophicum]QEE17018.1 putative ABC transporter ATP-binding protein [Candidatus Prometheoarchaeum syntrophicum]
MVYFGLDAEEYDRNYSDKDLLTRISKYFGKYKKSMMIVIIITALSSMVSGSIPFLTSRVISLLELESNLSTLILVILSIFLLNFLGYIFNFINQIYTARVVNKVVYDLREDVNQNVLMQDMSFFDKYPTGKIVSRINSDTQSFGEMSNIFMQAAASLFAIIVIFIPLLSINLKLSGIFSLMIPVIFVFTLSFRKIARKKALQGQRILATVNAFVQETMAGIQIAKTFRQEDKLYSKFKKVNKQSYIINRNRAYYLNLMFPGLNMIQGITLTLVTYFGGTFILGGTNSGADIVLFTTSLASLFFPFFSIASFWPQFQTGMAAVERSFTLIDSTPLVVQENDIKIEKLKGKIQIKDLNFYYQSEKPIFKNFNLDINPGESVAIVGHTGAGKSSLARLLLRFYNFQSGDIIVDDNNIRKVNLESYRKKVGFIPQTAFLWADTLENNVRYGSENKTREEILWALDQAGGKDWIDALPKGIETDIRERGKLLSMGQRQLVVFARVLLQNPSILILDEATASVDPFTETKIVEATEKLMEGRTSIIIAHRLRTVRHVDRIIVLDHGQIVEEGNHDNLMEKNGYYAKLYQTYFMHQSYEFIDKIKTTK